MPKLGTCLLSACLLGLLVASAGAQPGAAPPAEPPSAEPPPEVPTTDQPPRQAAPAIEPGSTQATFVSTSSRPWEVLVDRQPACETPCSIYVPPMRFVTLRSRDRILLDVGYLPQGSVVVRGTHLSDGAYAGGIVGTTFAGLGVATGITLTAVGCATDRSGMCTAGLITGGVSVVGLVLSIRLMMSAVPKAEVLPGQPYVAGNTVGLAGTF